MNGTIDAGWIPDLQTTVVTPSPWAGQLKFRAFENGWSRDSWFAPPAIDVTIVVRENAVEIWADGRPFGSVPRDELRTWFAHGTGAMPAGNAAWTARPMGVAITVPDVALWPVPAEIATHLAGHL